jgi:hypothetical protein
MESNFENLSFDLASDLLTLKELGKLKPPYEVSLTDTGGRFLGSFEVGLDGKTSLLSENTDFGDATFPVTVELVDSVGTHYRMTWSPPAVH